MTDHSAFAQLPAEQVIQPKFIATYQRRWSHFFLQLGRLRDNLYLLQRLVDFPFELFGVGVPGWSGFFTAFVHNALDANIMLIARIQTDEAGDLYTLNRFKRDVRDWLLPQHVSAFEARLRELRFNVRTKELLARVKALRDRSIAHLSLEHVDAASSTDVEAMVCEHREIAERLELVVSGLQFNAQAHFGLYAWTRHTEPERFAAIYGYKIDIEVVLDALVTERAWALRFPETHRDDWLKLRPRMSKAKLATLNELRARRGIARLSASDLGT